MKKLTEDQREKIRDLIEDIGAQSLMNEIKKYFLSNGKATKQLAEEKTDRSKRSMLRQVAKLELDYAQKIQKLIEKCPE